MVRRMEGEADGRCVGKRVRQMGGVSERARVCRMEAKADGGGGQVWPQVTSTAPGLLTLTRLVTAMPSQCQPRVAQACHRATFDCSSGATEILIHNG